MMQVWGNCKSNSFYASWFCAWGVFIYLLYKVLKMLTKWIKSPKLKKKIYIKRTLPSKLYHHRQEQDFLFKKQNQLHLKCPQMNTKIHRNSQMNSLLFSSASACIPAMQSKRLIFPLFLTTGTNNNHQPAVCRRASCFGLHWEARRPGSAPESVLWCAKACGIVSVLHWVGCGRGPM